MSFQSFQSDRPRIALIGQDAADLASLEGIVGPVAEVTSSTLLSAATAHEMRAAPVVLLDATDVSAAEDADAVACIAGEAAPPTQLIVRTSLANLDLIDALCPRARIVIGRDPADLHLALASSLAAVESNGPFLSDVATDEGMRLQRLADEIARIARTLVDLPEGLSGPRLRAGDDTGMSALSQPDDGANTAEVTAAEVRAIIRLRRMRDRYFAPDLFADPAWDMLLDLAAARIERVRVAVSSLCIAAAVPPTTALRWIKAMTDKGLLRRVADQHDARRIFIQLSDDAAEAMDKYLRAVRSAGGSAI